MKQKQKDFVSQDVPLADRVRPKLFDELFGQDKIWSKDSALRKLISKDAFNSLIFWGPPGCGKTTLGNMIASHVERDIVFMSAVHATVKEIREHTNVSKEQRTSGGRSILLFMDEIHRLSKSQQDVLLPALESGDIKFIGATTENPSFEVNSAVLSRSLTFRFEPLPTPALIQILKRATTLPEANFPKELTIDEDVYEAIANSSDADARRALNLLDALVQSLPDDCLNLKKDSIEDLSLVFTSRYDRAGDQHYDIISAMIKSIRASNPDAAIYYLARMISAGEDPVFIARRILIAASEDVGNANPTALLVATAAMQAVHMIGYPEARIILAQAVTYLSSSPKSNRSYLSVEGALVDVEEYGSLEVPMALRNAPTKFMKNFGYGKGYAYAHSRPSEAKNMKYLPKELNEKIYYHPSDFGVEKQLKLYLSQMKPSPPED